MAQAAGELGVSSATIRRACDAGVLPCRRSPGGHRRVERAALEGMTRERLLRAGKNGAPPERDVLRALADLGEVVSRWGDVDGLLRSAAISMLEATGAVTCDIYRLEEEGVFRCLVSQDVTGPDEEAIGAVLRTHVFAVAREAIETGRVVVVDDRSHPLLGDEDAGVYDEYGFESEIVLPLLVQDRVVGIVDLYADRPRGFRSALDYARGAALLVAGALEKALLLDALQDRTRVLRELFDLAQLLSRTYDVGELLRTIAGRLLASVQAARCDIYQRQGDAYRCVAGADADGRLDPRVGSEFDLAGNPSCLQAVSSDRTLLVSDVDDSRLSETEKAWLSGRGFRSELCIPLVVNDTDIGFIELLDTRARDWKECLEFAAGVGQLVAGALENAGLVRDVEQRNQDLRTLVEGGLEFGSTLDLDRVLLSIARRMRGATGASACDIYALEGDRLLALVAVDDTDEPDADFGDHEYPLADYPLAAEAVRTGRAVSVHDVTTDARASVAERAEWGRYGLRAGVIVPLIHGTRMVGATALYGRAPRSFEQLDLLRGLSQVAGQAIVNARLYEELDRGARQARLLNDLSAELAGTMDTDRLLEAVARRVRVALDAAACTAFVIDAAGRPQRLAASRRDGLSTLGVARDDEVAFVAPLACLAAAGARGSVVSLSDPHIDKDCRAWLERRGVEACLMAPLMAKDEVIGVLEVSETRAGRVFSTDETELVKAVCRVTGLAIDNALLFDGLGRRNQEAELLNEIARRTSASLDLGDIAAETVACLSRLTPIDSHTLALLQNDELRVIGGSEPARRPLLVATQSGAAGAFLDVVREERVVVLDGPAAAGATFLHLPDPHAVCSVVMGLFEQHMLIGVLLLSSRTPGAFAALDTGVLERIGVHLSLAANNARLYQEIKTLHLSNLIGLSTALNAKDYYTLGHAARVAAYMVLLGEELGWEPEWTEQVREAAYLHDIGKIGVSDRILVKQGPLNAEEWELMRQHPVVSAEIIKPLFGPELVAAVRHHHERFDGQGYPAGLVGLEIPELARALCVVDSYDAMSLQRPYRAARTFEECLYELRDGRGTQFDPHMTDAFLHVLEGLTRLREGARRAADEAAALIDPVTHAALLTRADEASPEYARVCTVLRDVRDRHPSVRFMTTSAIIDQHCVIVVDAEEEGSSDRSPLGEEVMADDAISRVLHGRPLASNVLFVDNFGVWVQGLAPLRGPDGGILAAVVADSPALSSGGAQGFARMAAETPVSALQEAAIRLSRAEIEAITDGLTGLYNHRYLHERLSEELARARQDGERLALLFCDLDYFKEFNDRLGHAAGDQALRDTARIIETCTRRADLVARYGGEEFVVVLPGAEQAEAVEIAGRIRASVAERYREDGALTISIGVAEFPDAAETKEALLEAADRALYVAKRLGRDRVRAAGAAVV